MWGEEEEEEKEGRHSAPSCLDMWGDRWSAGTGSVYTALPLYMSEELADKAQWEGPAPTFPSTSLLQLAWHPEPHPCQELLPTRSSTPSWDPRAGRERRPPAVSGPLLGQ